MQRHPLRKTPPATNLGTGMTELLLVGHLDTVYPNSERSRHNFRWKEDGDRIHVPGTVDIKGGNAMIWLILAAMEEARPELFHLHPLACPL